ncbi:DUF6455 family protein [Aliisedimentitalea scapharcae]|uniref:DUF6455 family protein n=1 Tax=Aliisedimentitalea scapharcae TaxID=1524259 RepID=A0ABZ2XZK5_9RHOB
MGLFSKVGQSSDLVNGMAERMGVDFADAIGRDPEMEAQKYRRAVMRCSQCSNQTGCVELQGGTTELDKTPDYCMNSDLFAHMKAE